jgi:Domain of unknown function (DUF5916)
MRANTYSKKCKVYHYLLAFVFNYLLLLNQVNAQNTPMTVRPSITAQKTAQNIKIDGIIDEPSWKAASLLNNLTEFRPTPFKAEHPDSKSEIYIMYNDLGIYVAGHCYESTIDSVTRELIGRDGFGNNDFFGLILDTYNDKINGFEYFVTPLGEQMDAKATSNGEDFSWNAVWESASKIHDKGWDFEMFIPFSAIRFGKDKVQKWGLQITRRRIKTGQQYAWATVNPQINGFLTQEGFWEGLTDIKPPIRLQLSPYISFYNTTFSKVAPGEKKSVNQVNGGLDLKYGINQAFTLDMTLIPDFGQVQTDNRVLNLGPFEQKYNEQRPFFTEGLELFNKGGLFYSRRIGKNPFQASWDYQNVNNNEEIFKDPQETKVINATKVSGRMQNGLAVGVLNAVTNTQYATIRNLDNNENRKTANYPLTNYNMIVLDKTFKYNSSVSFVNTNVLRNGSQYDANVSMGLFDLNDKTNTWNIGGKAGISQLIGKESKNSKHTIGYIQSLYFGKTSGRFNFNIWSDLADANYSQNDMGYATNNNFFDNGFYTGYNINKPKGWYNQIGMNINGSISHLVSALDPLKQNKHLFQSVFIATNLYGQAKNLWWFNANINQRFTENDYYEARSYGRVFKRAGRTSIYMGTSTNNAKKYSANFSIWVANGYQFKNTFNHELNLGQKYRFNQRFSLEHSITYSKNKDQAGFGKKIESDVATENFIYFTRRDRETIENNFGVKYSFTNKMWLNVNVRYYWSGVNAKEILLLKTNGQLESITNTGIHASDLNQNYNAFALNMVYTWQIANGSFLTLVWKDEAEDFVRGQFINDYSKNIDRTFSNNNINSLSARLIYFIDYASLRKNKSNKK